MLQGHMGQRAVTTKKSLEMKERSGKWGRGLHTLRNRPHRGQSGDAVSENTRRRLMAPERRDLLMRDCLCFPYRAIRNVFLEKKIYNE